MLLSTFVFHEINDVDNNFEILEEYYISQLLQFLNLYSLNIKMKKVDDLSNDTVNAIFYCFSKLYQDRIKIQSSVYTSAICEVVSNIIYHRQLLIEYSNDVFISISILFSNILKSQKQNHQIIQFCICIIKTVKDESLYKGKKSVIKVLLALYPAQKYYPQVSTHFVRGLLKLTKIECELFFQNKETRTCDLIKYFEFIDFQDETENDQSSSKRSLYGIGAGLYNIVNIFKTKG